MNKNIKLREAYSAICRIYKDYIDKHKIYRVFWELRNILFENNVKIVAENGNLINVFIDGKPVGCNFTKLTYDMINECWEDL